MGQRVVSQMDNIIYSTDDKNIELNTLLDNYKKCCYNLSDKCFGIALKKYFRGKYCINCQNLIQTKKRHETKSSRPPKPSKLSAILKKTEPTELFENLTHSQLEELLNLKLRKSQNNTQLYDTSTTQNNLSTNSSNSSTNSSNSSTNSSNSSTNSSYNLSDSPPKEFPTTQKKIPKLNLVS